MSKSYNNIKRDAVLLNRMLDFFSSFEHAVLIIEQSLSSINTKLVLKNSLLRRSKK